MTFTTLTRSLLILLGCLPCVANADPVDFAHQVVPLLKKHCAQCHAGDSREGGFSLNTRPELLAGSEHGPVVELGKAAESRLIQVVMSSDADERMPPEGPRLKDSEVELLRQWINQGLPWEDGFAFKAPAYEPPLLPRNPELPPAQAGREHPIDRLVDHYLSEHQLPQPAPISDAVFARRAALDLIGLLPEPEQLDAFLQDTRPDKRARFIDQLLADDMAYAEHWLTFWNDLLRNDYDGTGFITGGRKQISGWLYEALINNKPYDQFVRELIAPPTDESRGFIEGIKWRGEVSAGQTVEIQFAQSVSQALLGINMKCASCHDSFIDRWKLDEAYGLAAIYASSPLEIYRCDKPIGKTASAAWMFPELGQVDPTAPPAERLKQLADLLVHPQNGRLTRTITNRLWHRMLGRGVVHPTDAMQTEPWNADLLDWLASDFAAHQYDLKHTLRTIANSQTYQSSCDILHGEESGTYQFTGPRAKRMTAEQFLDTLWQLTAQGPTKMDAKFLRGKLDPQTVKELTLSAQWIWSSAGHPPAPAGEKIALRKSFELDESIQQGGAVVVCDNKFTLFLDGKKLASGDNWLTPSTVAIGPLEKGAHQWLVIAENQGESPNPAGFYFEARLKATAHSPALTIASDNSWQWSSKVPNDKGKYGREPDDWQAAVPLANQQIWAKIQSDLQFGLARANHVPERMIRASLVKADALMRTLGRPNRDQIVSMRPNELSTLEAIDLANGQQMATILSAGAAQLSQRKWESSTALTDWLYHYALSRPPTAAERQIAQEIIGSELNQRGIEDLLWAVVMLPEYQLIR